MQIASFEEIRGILLRLPEIVDRLEAKDPRFSDHVKIWLEDLETALANNRLSQASSVAALRSNLISAERGYHKGSVEMGGRRTARRLKEAAAIDSLRGADAIAADLLRGYASKIAEGEKLALQLVALSDQKGILQKFSSIENHTTMLTAIWSAMSEDPDLAAGTTALKGLVGFRDALILVDRMIPLLKSRSELKRLVD